MIFIVVPRGCQFVYHALQLLANGLLANRWAPTLRNQQARNRDNHMMNISIFEIIAPALAGILPVLMAMPNSATSATMPDVPERYCQLLGIDYKKHDETPEFTVYGAWYSVV
jgi:hypothetical protein